MDYQTRMWIRGGVSAAIAGGSNAVTLILIDPLTFNLFQGGATKLGAATLLSAIVGGATYMKSHPLPDPVKDENYKAVVDFKVNELKNTGTGNNTGTDN